MFLSRKQGVLIADVFCGETFAPGRADVVRYNAWPASSPGWQRTNRHSLALDMTRPAAELLEKTDKEVRYSVRRAQKDGVTDQRFSGTEARGEVERFCDFYDDAGRAIQLRPADRGWLRGMAEANLLTVSYAQIEGAPAVWHAYYNDARNAVLLYSASLHRAAAAPAFRQAVGRANRFLHWRDIEAFQTAGIATVDFGGWYAGTDDKHMLQINALKEEFGGVVVDSYYSLHGITLKGKLSVRYLEWMGKRRERRAQAAPKPA